MSACAGESTPLVGTPQWGAYNRDLSGKRFSPESQLNTSNAQLLKRVCSRQFDEDSSFETGPVVLGDYMFLTTGHTTYAIDARNCDLKWATKNSFFEGDSVDANRGVALLDGRLFRGTTDGYFFALDARTGRQLWSVKVLDPSKGERFTMAPIAWNGVVFVGDAVGDEGMAGNVWAFDAKTGREVWRRSTIDESTWPRGAATGGGGMWTSFSLDPGTRELFVSAANPAPDFLPSARPGDNLYTNSVLVLGALDGSVHWYYQVTPRDEHDWDLGAAPMLYTFRNHAYVAAGSKDGHLYVIDREAHRLRFKTTITTLENSEVPLSTKMLHVCPGFGGGVEWNGPAYDELTKQIVVGSVDWCGRYFQTPTELRGAQGFLGGGYAPDPTSSARGWIIAVDPSDGKIRWRYHAKTPVAGAITPTGGGITLAGTTAGDLLLFRSASGEILCRYDAGGPVVGGIVTYVNGARQYVAYATGRTLRTTFVKAGNPTITVMSL